MQLTSFTKMLLGVGAGVAVVGGGAGLLVARHHRKEAAVESYRATPVTVEQFVDKAITAYDRATYPSPYEPFDDYDDAFRKRDGKLQVGAEETLNRRHSFYPELVSIDEDTNGWYDKEINGRAFIRAADGDKDGVATREELIAAVTPFAGDDGMLDEAERRRVLEAGKLAVVIDAENVEDIAGWKSNTLITAYDAARLVLGEYRQPDKELMDDGSPAVRIADVAPAIVWAERGSRLGTGPITSVKPAMTAVDAAGNGNGLLSYREVANWLVERHGDDSLVSGHLTHDVDAFARVLSPQVIGRVDADSLAGKIYYEDDVPQADVDRFYGGSIPKYLDAVEGFREFRGDAAWQPDPTS